MKMHKLFIMKTKTLN